MKYFNSCVTVDEIKSMYKKLAKKYHPDLGGSTAEMQEVNLEYEEAIAKAIKKANLSEEQTESETLNSEEYKQAINKIIYLEGITIEVVGSWIWVTGQTRRVKATLKDAGFYFAPKKVAWYFRTEDNKVTRGGKKTLDEIRAKYGSDIIQSKKSNKYQPLKTS